MATGDATPTAVAMAVTVLCLRCHWPCHDQQGNDGRGRRAHPGSVAATPLGYTPLVTLRPGSANKFRVITKSSFAPRQ
jgi:hypothetical protein